MKKYLIFIPLVIIVILGGWALWPKKSVAPETGVGEGLPFGTSGGSNTFTQNIESSREGEIKPVSGGDNTNKLWKLTSTPVSGFVAIQKGTSSVVRYADRATGHIYDVSLPDVIKTRITNNTLPKIYKAVFRSDGNAVVYQSENENLSISLASTSTAPVILRGDIDSAVGQGTTLYYVSKENSKILSSDFFGKNTKELFSSPFNNWRISPPLIYTKAHSSVGGYLYSLSPFKKLLGPLYGLTVRSNFDGSKYLYSYFGNGTLKLKTQTNSEVSPASLAEKCVWSKKNLQVFYCAASTDSITPSDLDNWYLGAKPFSDYIWRFDTNTEAAKLIFEPNDYSLSVDVYLPALSPNEGYLVFINKNDLSLWAVGL